MLTRAQAGFTLTELLISSMLMSIVAIGICSVDVSRLRIQNDLRRAAGATSNDLLTELAVLNLEKKLETANRVVLFDTDADLVWDAAQIQVTTTLDPDNPATYRWDQFRLGNPSSPGPGRDLLFFRGVVGGVCPTPIRLTAQITELTFNFRDEAMNPIPGQVFAAGPEDNNVVRFSISWSDVGGVRTHDFVGEVTSRVAPYSNVGAVNGDSGTGTGTGTAASAVPPLC